MEVTGSILANETRYHKVFLGHFLSLINIYFISLTIGLSFTYEEASYITN